MSSESLRWFLKRCTCLKGPAIWPGQQAKLCFCCLHMATSVFSVFILWEVWEQRSPLTDLCSACCGTDNALMRARTSFNPAIWKQGISLLYDAGEGLEQLRGALLLSRSHFQEVIGQRARASWGLLGSFSYCTSLPSSAYPWTNRSAKRQCVLKWTMYQLGDVISGFFCCLVWSFS